MKIIEPSFEILTLPPPQEVYRRIEEAGRTCYKSEDKMTSDSGRKFVAMLMKRGHETVIEHVSMSVRFVIDRGVSHELVRHRLCAYSQESTRYCNYSKDRHGGELTFIRPLFWDHEELRYRIWEDAMRRAENGYLDLINDGAKPEEARSVLPNSLKTEIVTTANLREWRHIFKMRCSEQAHPQIRQVMVPLQTRLSHRMPELFKASKV